MKIYIMNNLKYLIVFFSFLLSITNLHSQDYKVEDVKTKDFGGVFELESVGFAIVYAKSGSWMVEIIDKDLNLLAKNDLGVTKSLLNVVKVFSNESSFCVLVSTRVSQHTLLSFDNSGNRTGKIEIEKELLNIYPSEDGYFIVKSNGSSSKSTDIVSYADNKLVQKWEKEFSQKFMTPNIYYANLDQTSINDGNLMNNGSSTNGILGWTTPNLNGTTKSISIVNSQGQILLNTECQENEAYKFIHFDAEEITLQKISFSGKGFKRKLDKSFITKYDLEGNLIEEIDTKMLDENTFKRDFFFLQYQYVKNDFFQTINSSYSTFEVQKLNLKTNEIQKFTAPRKKNKFQSSLSNSALGIAEQISLNQYSFIHNDMEKDEFIFGYLHYNQLGFQNSISIEFTSTSDVFSVAKTNQIDLGNLKSAIKVKWLDLFKINDTLALLSYYNKKEKSIILNKIQYN